MQSRRDQVQAHMFMMGRLTSGVLRLEPDGLDQPVVRTTRGTVIGLVLGVIAGVVIGLYGLLVPGGKTTWRTDGTLVVEKDSGSRYLYLGGQLHPVLNLASAKLLAGPQAGEQNVSSASLKGAARGTPVGIVGAPDSLPSAGALTGGTWLACANVPQPQALGASPTAGGASAGPAQLTLGIGLTPPGSGLSIGQGVVVSGPDGNDYLLWDGQRLRLDTADGALSALGYASAAPVPVTAAFLDAVPAGPDLSVPAVEGAGGDGPELAGMPSRIGQLFTDGSGDHYLLTEQGLVPLTATLSALYEGDPRVQAAAYGGEAVATTMIGPEDVAAHSAPASAANALTHGGALPPAPPGAVSLDGTQALCVQVTPGQGTVTTAITVPPASAVAAFARAPDGEPGVVPSCQEADLIAVQPGGGALVNAEMAGGGPGPTDYLVTDGGVKYPIASATALQNLGYGGATPTVLPTTLLGLLPTGPSLDPNALAATGMVPPPPDAPACAT